MDVIANKVGVYGRVREIGEQFTLADKRDLGSWMTPVDTEEAKAGIPRVREPMGTPVRAETGPNPAIASAYAEAGLQTTAVLLELQDARVRLGAANTRIADLEAEVLRLSAGRTGRDEVPEASARDEKAIASARKAEAEALEAAVEAAEAAQTDPRVSEDGDSVDKQDTAEEAAESREEAEEVKREQREAAEKDDEAAASPAPAASSGRRRRV